MARKVAAVVFSLGCLHASSSLALGLGDLSLESFLNEPLKAEVALLNTGNLHSDQIRIRLATREDFERMGVERAYFLTSIQFQVTQNERGQPVILMTSEDPVLEPYLDFIVEARWPTGRLLREYTVLVDPPLFDESSPVVSATERVAEVEGLPVAEKKSAESVTTGTRVDVRKSDLAPGEMPSRDFNAEASDDPISGRRYMIHRDDTLWEIARRAKPEGVSVHQTMLDIQRLNPNAFIDGNINRIKAGYIIYLPTEDEISSRDLQAALDEVRQQNADWEAGRASQPVSTGPSLRIAADEPMEGDSGDSDAAGDYSAGGSAALEDSRQPAVERSEMAEELASLEQQVDTLQRIVNLKDDQIAALQAALEEAGEGDAAAALTTIEEDYGEGVADALGVDDDETAMAPGEGDAGLEESDAVADSKAVVAGETVAEEEPEPEPAVAPQPEPKPVPKPAPQPEPESGFMSYLWYGLGAAVLAILAFVFMRRRSEAEPEPEQSVTVAAPVAAPTPAPAPADDNTFADVQLKDEPVEVVEEVPETEEPEAEPAVEEGPTRDDRGYGQHKHDEYASDVDAGDALAEADIYIAYGRYPQAVDLLKTAIAAEPNNAAYRLKLLEMYVQTDDLTAAEEQLRELESIGDANAVERAGQIFEAGKNAIGSVPQPVAEPAPDLPPVDLGDDPLERNFSGLEIEEGEPGGEPSEDLDLSTDFSESLEVEEQEEDDLVIAAETDGMSTKLDLARAYLDMGDEDGAKAILEEVTMEGSEEQKAEAASLLERIG